MIGAREIGAGFIDTIGDLLALQEDEATHRECHDQDEGTSEETRENLEEQQADDHRDHGARNRCDLSLREVEGEGSEHMLRLRHDGGVMGSISQQ